MTPKTIADVLYPADERMMRRVILIGLFLAITAFYAFTLPGNHSEAVDGYDYARRAETLPITKIDDTRSILFTLTNKLVYQGSEFLGLGVRSLPVLLTFEVLLGAASVLLMVRLLQSAFGLSRIASWSGGAFLGLSYGFWRYTGEAEVYVPSIFLILAALNLLFDALARESNRLAVIPAAVIAGLAGLYYQPNVIPLFIAAPVLMLSRRRFPSLVVYGAVGSVVILAGIVAAYVVEKGTAPTIGTLIAFVTSRGGEFQNHPLNLPTLLTMVQAILHSFVSLNWLFAIDVVTQWMERVYPANAIAPKVFAAEHYRPLVYIAVPLFAFLVGLTFWMVASSIRNVRRLPFDRRSVFCLLWFVALFAIVAILDPTSREPWIMALPPIIILVCVHVFEPLAIKGRQTTILLFLSTLLLCNFFGGMGIVQEKSGDFYYNQLAWLRENTSQNDVILFGDQNDHRRASIYLQYVAKMQLYIYPPIKGYAENEDLAETQFIDNLFKVARTNGSRIFALSEFFTPDWDRLSKSWHNQKRLDRAKKFMERIRSHARLVDSGPLGDTFEIVSAKP